MLLRASPIAPSTAATSLTSKDRYITSTPAAPISASVPRTSRSATNRRYSAPRARGLPRPFIRPPLLRKIHRLTRHPPPRIRRRLHQPSHSPRHRLPHSLPAQPKRPVQCRKTPQKRPALPPRLAQPRPHPLHHPKCLPHKPRPRL